MSVDPDQIARDLAATFQTMQRVIDGQNAMLDATETDRMIAAFERVAHRKVSPATRRKLQRMELKSERALSEAMSATLWAACDPE